jgi:hypothetical protein
MKSSLISFISLATAAALLVATLPPAHADGILASSPSEQTHALRAGGFIAKGQKLDASETANYEARTKQFQAAAAGLAGGAEGEDHSTTYILAAVGFIALVALIAWGLSRKDPPPA